MSQPPAILQPHDIRVYLDRTTKHIKRVSRLLRKHAWTWDSLDFPLCAALMHRAATHDASKFSPEEAEGYVWLTAKHRARKEGREFSYPEGVQDTVDAAVRHHVTTNTHHLEAHADVNRVPMIDLIELACDWTAMSLEQNETSAVPWAQEQGFPRYPDLTAATKQTILDLLDRTAKYHVKLD